MNAYHVVMDRMAELHADIRSISDGLDSKVGSSSLRRTALEAAAKGKTGREQLETIVRVIFERELQLSLNSGWQVKQEHDSDPLDARLMDLLGKQFPRPNRISRLLRGRIRRGLDKQSLKLRVHREFYRALYRYAADVRAPGQRASKPDGRDRIYQADFFRILAAFFGSDQVNLDLPRLDRLVQRVIDWCLSILPYHAPDLCDEDLHSLIPALAPETYRIRVDPS
jgi:hypothetical protein